MGQDFLAWWERFEQDPQAALDELDKYHFVGATFNNTMAQFVATVYEMGWEDGSKTLSFLLNEQGQVEIEFSSVKAYRWAQDWAAKMVKQINESTRDMLRETIQSSVNNEEPWQVLKQKLMDGHYAFSERRCETIARTESGMAYNIGAVDCWKESELVDSVLVIDGDYDPECEAVNGQTWTFDEAIFNPLEHPNCVREFFPNLKGVGSK